MNEQEGLVRAIAFIIGMLVTMTVANAQNASGSPDQGAIEGWPPVPPLQDQAVIGNYCIHRNLLYSLGDILCLGGLGLVCAPASGTATGGRAYWSSNPVNRGDVNWTPPAHCGK